MAREQREIVECDIPRTSALGRDLMERADFRDAYRALLHHPDPSVVDIFFAIFGHRPAWMNVMLIARNKVAALVGLEVPTTAEIMNVDKEDHYSIGEKIGPWPIFFSAPTNSLRGATTNIWILGCRS